jgi:hypothetical protein
MRIYLFLMIYLSVFVYTDAYAAGCIKGNCKNGEGHTSIAMVRSMRVNISMANARDRELTPTPMVQSTLVNLRKVILTAGASIQSLTVTNMKVNSKTVNAMEPGYYSMPTDQNMKDNSRTIRKAEPGYCSMPTVLSVSANFKTNC